MRITTALNHEKRLKGRLADCYYFARMAGWTHEKLLATTKERVWDDEGLKRCPGWVRERLQAISSEWHRALYQPKLYPKEFEKMLEDARAGKDVEPAAYLRFAHRLDGKEITTDEICAIEDEEEKERAWQEMESTHIWNHRGIDYPFSPWKP